ncbi:MAG: hypothetical protein J7L79_04735 [Thaumarchaeota archaeon]|nr:hypothetical protein [Nitrososphaerota archaeon]
MTELLIVSKPRGRIFKWIGGGVYKAYKPAVSGSKSDSVSDLTVSGAFSYVVLYYGYTMRAQQYVVPDKQNLAIRKVSIHLRRVGSPTGTLYIELWSDNGDLPGSKIADIRSKDVSTISTDGQTYDFTPSETITLDPNTEYWIVVRHEGGDDPNHIEVLQGTSDLNASWYSAYYDGSWHREANDYNFNLYLRFINLTFEINLDFIYSGTAIKRLQGSVTPNWVTIKDVKVNGQSVGASLERGDEIPQADSYTVTYEFGSTDSSYSLTVDIQHYLYYNKTSITIDDLDVSEAYLQEIEFGSDGGS